MNEKTIVIELDKSDVIKLEKLTDLALIYDDDYDEDAILYAIKVVLETLSEVD